MSTSLSNGILPISSTLYGTDDDPMDSVLVRRGVANNLMHLCDSYGQVRVNYHPANVGNADTYATIETPDAAGIWYLMGACPMGPWPLTLRADGTPYRLIVRVGGSVSSGVGTGTFRVVIAPSYDIALEGRYGSTDSVFECDTTSTTAEWMTGASQGSVNGTTYMEVTRAQAESWTTSESTYDAVSSGTPVSVRMCLVSAWVWAKTTNTSAVPRLHALHIREYMAP